MPSGLKRSPMTLVVLHGLWVVAMLVNMLSGFRIAADDQHTWAHTFSAVLPQGSVLLWHVISAAMIGALLLGYAVYYVQRRRHNPPNKRKPRSYPARKAHWLAYALLLVLVPISAITGVLNVTDLTPSVSVSWHRYSAYGYLAFIGLHMFAHAWQGGLKQWLSILRPTRKAHFVLQTLLACTLTAVLALVWLFNSAQTLNAPWLNSRISIDGIANEPAWQNAPDVSVLTQHGANLLNGRSTVWAKALHDGDYLYVYVRWQDPTRSQKHLPLVKTKDGWRIMQTEFLLANENAYYEDKFAILLADGDSLANLKSIHLGKQPLHDQPEALNGRGLHYTTGGKIYDLWHWQSVRSNVHQQADDNYFGPAKDAPKHFPRQVQARQGGTFRRYTAGYQKDPPTSWGGVGMNWESFDVNKVKPRRLPKEADEIDALQGASLKPSSHDQGDWWMAWDDTKPYLVEHDTLPIGSILPGVLIKPKREGDRGHIHAAGRWSDGYWHLEMKRKLNTHSPFDVAISNNTYLWFAVFDHTQTQHSRHVQPLKLKLAAKTD